MKDIKIENSQKKAMWVWGIIFLLSTVVCISGLFNFDINSSDGLKILVGSALSITSLVCIGVFKKRSDALDRAIKAHDIVTYFRYSKKEWNKLCIYEYEDRRNRNASIFKLFSILFVLIFGGFILFSKEAKLEMLLVCAGFIVFFGIVAYTFPLIMYYMSKDKRALVVILEKGVLVNKTFHSWDFPLSKLLKARHVDHPFERIEITYEFWDRLGPRNYTINVPVSVNEHVDVSKVVKKLQELNGIKPKSKVTKKKVTKVKSTKKKTKK